MTQRTLTVALVGAVSALALTAAGCSRKNEENKTTGDSPAAASQTTDAGKADADMQAVLDKLASLGGKPIETLTPTEARAQPTPAAAVMALMKEKGIAADTTVTTKDIAYTAGAGSQKARVYTPVGAGANTPVVLYIHGGGWVIADLDTYDGGARALAKESGAIVVSIEYRHAPEAKFPAAHDDAVAAYRWLLANAKTIGGDPTRIAVAGESAGGNMAVNVAIAARDMKLQAPKAIIAVYPVADSNMATGSKVAKATAKPLNTPMLAWFFTNILAKPGDALDPRLNLVAATLEGLPPTTIILAEIDPLHDDGVNLADKLKAAGVQTDLKEYAGVTHEFFGMGPVVADAKDAEAYAGSKLKAAFGI
ncbi:alpha/beta hydrolase [Caulobacter sp.]|uniref:alpha/beta hydrolase n=1 Tax=Caulobacter sp. TaxID=78 RepID=UPI001B215BDD|nr:alpha/beta hydrolase [Caulobacter sp.]MBO9547151.1 alpha/beta hydrolase [Caulobacter sp.]